MEGRLPPDDELFEWTESPEPPAREEGTGETEAPTGERRRRSDTGERRAVRGDTGEFERSGRTPPPGRRARHRDLPGRVRRRQAAVVGAVALVIVIGLVVAVSGGGDGGTQEQIALKRLIGQTIVARLDKRGADQALVRRIRLGRVGGVLAFPGNAQSLRADVQELQAVAEQGGNPPLLVMIDQEGGDVKRLPDGPPDRSPQQLGAADDPSESEAQGSETGAFLRDLGVNVDLAPVLDVPQPNTARSIASRTFGNDPALVTRVGVPFALGLQEGSVVSAPKHFPGLGRATVSTDERPVAIAATSDELQSDIDPFRAAIEVGVDMVMVSTASYPTLTPGSRDPAAFSPQIVRGLLRDQLGFEGLVITDDLEAPAVEVEPGPAAALALRAGNDLLLYAKSPGASDQAFRTLVSEVNAGRLDRALFADAYERITSVKEDLP
jgi:beta-N-acetylhexosaminidase